MDIRVSVIGAGSWGTTVASLAARNAPTVLWSRRAALAEQIDQDHENGDYLEGHKLPVSLRATADLEEAVRHADVLVMGVPSQGFRSTLQAVKLWPPPALTTPIPPDETPQKDEDACAALAHVEARMRRIANDQQYPFTFKAHAITVGINVALPLLIQGLGLRHWTTAFIGTLTGTSLGELMMWTQPRSMEGELERYLKGELGEE